MKQETILSFYRTVTTISLVIVGFFVIWGIHQWVVYAFTWSTQDLETGPWQVGPSMDVVSESTSVTHFAYCNENNLGVRYISTTNDVPGTPEQVHDANTLCTAYNIDLELVGGDPQMLFNISNPSQGLMLALRDGGGNGSDCDDTDWSCYTVTSTAGAPSNVNMEVDGGTYHIAFKNANLGVVYGTCSASCTATSSWSFETVDSTGSTGRGLRLELDSSSVPVLAYTDPNTSKMVYAKRESGSNDCSDTDWQCFDVDTASAQQNGLGLAINSSDQSGIAYEDGSGALRFALADGGDSGCSDDPSDTFTCESADTDIGAAPYIDMKFKSDVPLVAWYLTKPGDFTFGLRMSYKYAGSWSTDTVTDLATTDHFYPSIDYSGDLVSIGYYRDFNNEAAVITSTVNFNIAPTSTFASTPSQTSANTVSVSAVVTDAESDESFVLVEHSLDNASWSSSTIGTVSQGGEGDGVTTSTGRINSVDTDDDGSVTLSFDWLVGTDVTSTEDNTVYMRLTIGDGVATSSVTSSAFAIDTKAPTAPGSLTVASRTETTAVFSFGATSTDTNFSEYRVYRSTSTPVTASDTAHTSSTDANLGSATYGGATSTTLSSLTPNTLYYVNIFAFDNFDNNTSSSAEVSTTTLANVPTSVTASADSTSAITVSWNANSNPSGTEYFVSNTTAGTNSGWITDTSHQFASLSENTNYSFVVKARNSVGVETAATTAANATTEEEQGGGGSVTLPPPPPPPPPDPDTGPDGDDCDPDVDECEDEEVEIDSSLFNINNGALYTNSRNVMLHFLTEFIDEYAVSNDENLPGEVFTSPVPSSQSFELSEGDGEKTVYGRFKNQYGIYEATDRIILDTVPPEKPTVSLIDNGVKNGALVTPPRFAGTAEAGTSIRAERAKVTPPYTFTFDAVQDCITRDLYSSAIATLGPDCAGGNAPTVVSSPVGGTALQFDGANDEVRATSLPIDGDGAFTLATWVQLGGDTFNRQVLLSYGGTNDMVSLEVQKNVLRVFDDINNGDKVIELGQAYPNTWYHITVLVTSDGKREYYVNGTLISTNRGTGLDAVEIENPILSMGRRQDRQFAFLGTLDTVVLMPRVATGTEIAQLVAPGDHLFSSSPDTLDDVGPKDIIFDMNEGNGCFLTEKNSPLRATLLPGCDTGDAPIWTDQTGFGTGYALEFDGVNDYVNAGILQDIGTEGITLSTRFYLPSGFGTNAPRTILLAYGAVNDWITFDITHGGRLLIWDDINNSNTAIWSDNLTADAWYHIALVLSPSGERTLYLNGVKDASVVREQHPYTDINTQSLVIGARRVGTWNFRGIIDDVAVYNRMLSDADVAALASGGSVSSISSSHASDTVNDPFVSLLAQVGQEYILAATQDEQTSTVESDGSWEFAYSSFLGPGGYVVELTAVDAAGNESEPTTVSFSIPETDVPGCMDSDAPNYNPDATTDDGSCANPIDGCTDSTAYNYNASATVDDGSCVPVIEGCTNANAANYDASANTDDGSCTDISGCTDPWATNFNVYADIDNGSCTYSTDEDEETDGETDAGDDTGDDGTDGSDTAKNGSGETDTPIDAIKKAITDTSQSISRTVSSTVDSVETLLNRQITQVEKLIENAPTPVQRAIDAVRKVIDNPTVEKTNTRVVAPTVAAVGAINVGVAAGGFHLPQAIAFFKYLFTQPMLLLRRKRRRRWGTIFDAYSKQPVDLVTIRLIDNSTGGIVRSQVTDARGRYFMIVEPGMYRIEVDKPGYEISKKIYARRKHDVVYGTVYMPEEVIRITDDNTALNFNIPLESIGDQAASEQIVRQYIKQTFHFLVSIIGMLVAVLSFIISPTVAMLGLIIFHVLMFTVFQVLSQKRGKVRVGVVREVASKNRLGRVAVRVFDATYDKLVQSVITDHKGRYGVLVGPSTYYVTYEKHGFEKEQSKQLDYSSAKTKGVGGIIARDEHLRPQEKGTDNTSGGSKNVQTTDQSKINESKVVHSIQPDGDIDDDDIDKLKEIAQYGGKDS